MATALLKFVQGATIGDVGEALLGAVGTQVDITNGDNSGVGSWEIQLLEVPYGSALVKGVLAQGNGAAVAANFLPDVAGGCYRVQLRVWSQVNRQGTVDTDIRNFGIVGSNLLLAPPPQVWPEPLPDPESARASAKPNEMNFSGQPAGWAGSGNDGLLRHALRLIGQGGDDSLTQVYYVDDTKLVSGTRDGSMSKPFENMSDALTAFFAGGQSGVIYVASCDGSSFTVPAVPGGNSYLRIVGMRDTLGDGTGRTFIGQPNASVNLGGNTLKIIWENIYTGGWTFVGNSGANVSFHVHNSRFGSLNVSDSDVTLSESYFYDSYFLSSTFTITSGTAGAPHFHNCTMGNITFGANGQRCYLVAPTNRVADHAGQGFTLEWPSSNAGNKVYLDGVGNYLRTGGDLTLTNGTHVLMA